MGRNLALAAPLAVLALGGCFVASPEDMELSSPDGQFRLLVDFEGGGLTLRPGLRARLTLKHKALAQAPFATLDPVRNLEMSWAEPRVIRICAPAAKGPTEQIVSVPTPDGAATFQVRYVCPARPPPP